ncbi:non-ribosomal peptide synthetase [Streptomyces sp. MP131-18]|uniref:non-ribosomal peptide synthetase n=1 Tax=Streptomyces sp. MP131-18 TaxID=1857892 RepID=UPI00097CBAA9|nr:non-ribosomal peptide synthetase [Streptomyces sp. MP131-18]ONK12120.1 Linear gramicidin synthase subunit D [Streptomyces sp. MP131-18]
MTERPAATFPMSFEQESIWLNDQLTSGPSLYRESWVHRIRGDLDAAAVETALTALVARHEPLRTALVMEGGRAVQVVAPPAQVPLAVRSVPEDGLAAALHAAVSGPLPLDRPPLLRATLLRVAPRDAVLAVGVHHAAIDGWSLRLFDQEFSRLYRMALDSREPALPDLPMSFGSYARAQRATADEAADGAADEAADAAMAYWRRTLAGAPEESAFPLDRPRPAAPEHGGGQHEFVIGPELGAALRRSCRELRTTPFVLLTAALTALLVRLGGQEDVVLGTPVTRRDTLELEPLIACLSDVMPLRQRTRRGQTFRELVADTRSAVRGAMAHTRVPHSRLVRELVPERTQDRFPLFQVVVTVDDADAPGLDLPGATAERLYCHGGTAKFDVFLNLVPRDGGYLGLLEYATEIFDPATARRIGERFVALLTDATSDEDRCLDDLRVMSEDERTFVVETLSRGPAAAAGDVPPAAHERVDRAARLRPDALAVVHGEHRMTYGELAASAAALAGALTARGLARQRIGIMLDRSVDALVAVLGVLYAGGACVPLDPALPADRLSFLLRDSEPAAVLTRRAGGGLPGVETILVEDVPAPAPGGAPRPPLPAVGRDDPAYLVYTSGSTGRPKGVVMPHRSLAALVDWQCGESSAEAGPRTAQFAPLGFDVAFQEMFCTWAVGGTLVLVDDHARSDPHRLLDLVEHHAVDRLFLPYVALQVIAEYAVSAGRRPASLREVITAGEELHVTPAIRELFTTCPLARLENQYGPSETHVVTRHRLTGPPVSWPDRPPIGRPVPGSRVYVLDGRLRPRPVGAVGEICVAGDSVAVGYRSGGDANDRRFVTDPFGPAGGLLYRTGDLGAFLPDGSLRFLGRGDDQTKVRGYRVEPGEVEAALKTVPGITDAVVVAEGGHATERRLVAYYTAAEPDRPAPGQVRQALAGKLPAYLVPSVATRVPGFPRTHSGKTDRAAVHRRYAPTARTPRPAPVGGRLPAGTLERELAALWAEVLHVEAVEPDRTFFSYGGDSLLAVRLAVRVRAELGLPAHPSDILAAQTLSALARTLGERGRAPEAHDLGEETTLDPGIVPAPGPAAAPRPPDHVLLTGATGFLGAFLLHDLLERTPATVHCLVRAPDPAAAFQRLRHTLMRYHLWNPAHAGRIEAVPGDLARGRLGLGQRAFDRLARHVDAVFHTGAEVNLTYPYDRLKAANVDGTAEILRLAAAHRAVPVHHVSTVGVFPAHGRHPAGRVLPDHPLGDGALLRHGYARTKWVAEALVAEAGKRGLRVTVYRPTRISGHTGTGVCQTSDFLWLLVKGCLQAGLAPRDYAGDFDLVPVDYVSAAIGALAADPSNTGGIFHLSSERRLPFTEIVSRLRTLGHRIDEVPLEQWHRHLEQQPGNAAFPLLGLLPARGARPDEEPPPPSLVFDSASTRRALRGSEVTCPPIDDALFARYISSFVTDGFLPPP